MKHLKVHHKYFAARCIFNSLLGVSSGDETLRASHAWFITSRIFYRVSTLYRVEGGRTARKFQKRYTVLWRNPKIAEIINTPFTFPRTFVQDCRSICSRTGQLDPKVYFLSSYIMQNLIFFKLLACKTSSKFKLCSLKGLDFLFDFRIGKPLHWLIMVFPLVN